MTRVRRRRGPILLNAALAVALVTGAGFGYAAVNDDGKSSGTPRVRTAAVARGTVLASVSASGTLVSPSDTGVSFGASGKVTAVNVKVGDQVKTGQVLARMDTAQADEDLAAAQSGVDVAQANLDKAEKGTPVSSGGQGGSGGSGGGSNGQQADVRPAAAGADETATEPAAGSSATPRPQTSGSGKQTPAPTVTVTITKTVAASPTPSPSTTVDAAQVAQAQNALVQAQNKLAQAQRAVDATVLKAPNDGVVASVAGKVGDTVGTSGGSGSGSTGGSSGGSGGNSGSSASSSTPSGFVVLTNPGGMQAAASFSEADAGKIKTGQAAVVTLNVDSTVKRNAKVVSINPLPDSGGSSGSVKYSARVALDGDLSTLRTGQTASIQVVVQEADNALYVPAGAVTGTGTTGTVQVDVAGNTERRQVELGVKGDQTTQILTGLNEGDLVVIGIQGTTGTGTGSTGQTGTGTTRGGLGGGGLGGGGGAGSLGIPSGAGGGGGAGFGGGGR